jgi:F-type H+-transporting ATPase subunit b
VIAAITLSGGQLASVHVRTSGEVRPCDDGDSFNNPSQCATKEPNPILPEMREVVWGVGSFILLAILMRVVLYPRLQRSMDARAARIQGDLDSADHVTSSVAGEQRAYADRIASAHAEAATVLDAARAKAEAARSERVAALNAELAQMRSAATVEVDGAKASAHASLADSVAQLAVRAASKVVAKPLDVAANRGVVDAFLNGANA